MSSPYLGEVRIFSFNFAPKGWAMCNGQLLPINQNQALFSILGTTYGGNGQTNFALPNLQGRMPVYVGNGITLGASAGEAAHTLLMQEMPQHTHFTAGSSTPANLGDPTGNLWAAGSGAYSPTPNTSMNPACVQALGGSQSHPNLSPYLVVTFCIALSGIFPSRN